jgi:hypothetical protein
MDKLIFFNKLPSFKKRLEPILFSYYFYINYFLSENSLSIQKTKKKKIDFLFI